MATPTIHQATPDNAPELARLLDQFDSMGATPNPATHQAIVPE